MPSNPKWKFPKSQPSSSSWPLRSSVRKNLSGFPRSRSNPTTKWNSPLSSKEDWREHVFGDTILNDVSARDVQLATSQWTLGKSFDTFCPIGPTIVTADEILDPHNLDIKLSIGGEILQHSNTRELIFKAPELIAYISSITALEPGDIISTGTPAGVGLGRTPRRWLQPGETMIAEVEGLGQLINSVTAAD